MVAASNSSVKMFLSPSQAGVPLLNAGHGSDLRFVGMMIVPRHVPPSPEASE